MLPTLSSGTTVVYEIRENEPNFLLEIKYQLFKPNLHRFEWIKRNFMKRMKNLLRKLRISSVKKSNGKINSKQK